jgi:hypothetical protein
VRNPTPTGQEWSPPYHPTCRQSCRCTKGIAHLLDSYLPLPRLIATGRDCFPARGVPGRNLAAVRNEICRYFCAIEKGPTRRFPHGDNPLLDSGLECRQLTATGQEWVPPYHPTCQQSCRCTNGGFKLVQPTATGQEWSPLYHTLQADNLAAVRMAICLRRGFPPRAKMASRLGEYLPTILPLYETKFAAIRRAARTSPAAPRFDRLEAAARFRPGAAIRLQSPAPGLDFHASR